MTPPTVDEVMRARRSYKAAANFYHDNLWEHQEFPALLRLIAIAEDQAFAELVRVEIERCRE